MFAWFLTHHQQQHPRTRFFALCAQPFWPRSHSRTEPVGACWSLLVPVGACWCLLVPIGAFLWGCSWKVAKKRHAEDQKRVILNERASFPPVFKPRVPCCLQQQRRRRSPKQQHIRVDLVFAKRFRFLFFHCYASSFCNMRHPQQPPLYFRGGSVRALSAMAN